MKGYKTLIFAMLIAVGGVLQTFDWATIIPQDKTWSGMAMIGVSGIIAALRVYTSTPIGTSAIIALAIGTALLNPTPSIAADLQPVPVVRKAMAPVTVAPWAGGFYFGVNGAGAVATSKFIAAPLPGAADARPAGAMAGLTLGVGAFANGIYIGAEADGGFDFGKAKTDCGFAPYECRLGNGMLMTQRLLIGATLPDLMAAAPVQSASLRQFGSSRRGVSAPAQWPTMIDVPATVSSATAMPYVTIGMAERKAPTCVDGLGCNKDWLKGWVAGAGIKVPVSSAVSMDVGYLYANWNKHTQPAPFIDMKATSEHMLKAGLQFHL